ncbi:MAG: leucine-rich repeat domain-containing protein [Patescibacteria group bacterium]
MKYFLGLLITTLIVGAIFLGFSIGKSSLIQSMTNNTSESVTADRSEKDLGVRVLDLSNRGITKVDSEIYRKTNTTDLILSGNNIKTLPSEMGRMTNLVTLKIDHNLLDGNLIGEVRLMSKLKILDVSSNNMTGIPAEIGQLNKLEILNYSDNKITNLPDELSKLRYNLKEFDLSGNPLSQEQISKLKILLPDTKIIFN